MKQDRTGMPIGAPVTADMPSALISSVILTEPAGPDSAATVALADSDAPNAPAATPDIAPSFAHLTDVSAIALRQRRLRRQLMAMRLFALVLIVAAIMVAGYPVVLQWQSDRRLSATTSESAQHVAGWPYPQAEDALNAARQYNERLAASGQPILGEARDPFSGAQGGSQASDDDTASSKDAEYQSLLDSGNGVMGAIRIPEISVDLPIYHGTSERSLASGAGHLYGSSLPVGGVSTHSVITGHRGLVEALMFTRLDEMKRGDFFYIDVMGETLGYQVDRITVIDPDDTSQLKIVPGEDRVTLMTCTPYGVNTQRLLVSGTRVSIPEPAPEPTDVRDPRTITIWTVSGVLLIGLIPCLILTWRRNRRAGTMRHGTRVRSRSGVATYTLPAANQTSNQTSNQTYTDPRREAGQPTETIKESRT